MRIIPLCVITCACAIDSEPPTTTDPLVDLVGVFRLDLEQDASGAHVRTIERMTADDAHLPVPALGSDYFVAAYSGGVLAEVYPIAFPTRLVIEGADIHGDAEFANGRVSIYLRAEAIDRIDVMKSDGSVIEQITTDRLPSAERRLRRSTPASMQHIVILDALTGYDQLPGAFKSSVPFFAGAATVDAVLTADDSALGMIYDALAVLTPGQLSAVQTVAIGVLHDGGNVGAGTVLAATYGSYVVLNSRYFSEHWSADSLKTTLAHEAAHAFNFLVDWDGDTSYWPAALQPMAGQLRDRFHLSRGLTSMWSYLHATGVQAGVSGDYVGDSYESLDGPTAIRMGFATNYGAVDVNEDIAEMTASLQYPNGDPRNVAFCTAMQAANGKLTQQLAMVYTKARLVTELGLATQARFDACVGGLAAEPEHGIRLGVDQPDDTLLVTTNLKAGFGDLDGVHYLLVLGDGPNGYHLLVQVLAPDNNALGIRRLDPDTITSIDAPHDAVFLANDNDARARVSGSGLLVVDSLTNERVQGHIFFLTLINAFGTTTDVFPISTFNAP